MFSNFKASRTFHDKWMMDKWTFHDRDGRRRHFNPISGRLLATPISGKGGGCLGPPPPLRSPVLTGRFLKFKRHSFRLNMIYISKKINFTNS